MNQAQTIKIWFAQSVISVLETVYSCLFTAVATFLHAILLSISNFISSSLPPSSFFISFLLDSFLDKDWYFIHKLETNWILYAQRWTLKLLANMNIIRSTWLIKTKQIAVLLKRTIHLYLTVPSQIKMLSLPSSFKSSVLISGAWNFRRTKIITSYVSSNFQLFILLNIIVP